MLLRHEPVDVRSRRSSSNIEYSLALSRPLPHLEGDIGGLVPDGGEQDLHAGEPARHVGAGLVGGGGRRGAVERSQYCAVDEHVHPGQDPFILGTPVHGGRGDKHLELYITPSVPKRTGGPVKRSNITQRTHATARVASWDVSCHSKLATVTGDRNGLKRVYTGTRSGTPVESRRTESGG
eukprot:1188783-Prorocentrum_minimum.AAC.1